MKKLDFIDKTSVVVALVGAGVWVLTGSAELLEFGAGMCLGALLSDWMAEILVP